MSDCAKRYPKQLSKKSPERKLCESTVRNRDVDLTPLACQLVDPSVSDFHKIPTRVHTTMTRHLALSLQPRSLLGQTLCSLKYKSNGAVCTGGSPRS